MKKEMEKKKESPRQDGDGDGGEMMSVTSALLANSRFDDGRARADVQLLNSKSKTNPSQIQADVLRITQSNKYRLP